MLWVVLQTLYELCHRVALIADLIDCIEQWEPGGRGWEEEEEVFRARKVQHDSWGFSSQCKWRKRRPVGLMRYLLVDEVFVLQDEVHLSSCGRSLQLLAVQHLFLELLDGLSEGSSAT